jgi:hypothetical protein
VSGTPDLGEIHSLLIELRGELRIGLARMDERHIYYLDKFVKHDKDIDELFGRLRKMEHGFAKSNVMTGVITGLFTAALTAAVIKFFVGG